MFYHPLDLFEQKQKIVCANKRFSHIFQLDKTTLATVGRSDTPGGEQSMVPRESSQ